MNTQPSKAKKLTIGSLVSIEELKVNDLFYMKYGFDKTKFRVHAVLEGEGVLAHPPYWLKNSAILIKNNTPELIHYAGRMSKLRAWFLL